MSADRIVNDSLSGTIVSSIGPGDIATLREQMKLWQPPRVDILVIATSGRFTTPAVRLIDVHNQGDNALRIEMWANSHLESLLATRTDRTDLLTKYGLIASDPCF